MSECISTKKLASRRRQLRERKYSFIELIMQTKKKIFKEKMKKGKACRERRAREGAD